MCPMPTAPVYTLRTYSENFPIFFSFISKTPCRNFYKFCHIHFLLSNVGIWLLFQSNIQTFTRYEEDGFCHLDWQPNPDYHWLGYHQFLFKLPSLFRQLDLLVFSIRHYKNSCTLLFPCQSHYENLVNKNVYIHVKCCSLTVYRADCCPYCEHTRPPDTQSNHRAVRQLPVTKSMHSVE